jgi:aminoglycoside phosphotransferase (APT) family kinase protein
MGVKERVILRDHLENHPALRAWAAVTSSNVKPSCIHVYRERPRKALYWLPGVAPGGASVYAKRAVARRTLIERCVYEEVLARLPLTAPRYYGSWLDGQQGWLFMEDVGAERYSETEPEQLALAGRWIATLHVGAAGLPAARSLPDGGPARYLTHLRTAREKITRSLARWRYPESEIDLLTAVLSRCDALEGRWARVEAVWDNAPTTVIHGDFRPKNAFLRRNGQGLNLFPIDWETAGWGPPGPDLTRIDLRAYWSVARTAWPEVSFDSIDGWCRMGRLLEEIAAVMWVSETLKCESAKARSWAVADLGAVLGRMDAAVRAARVLE